MKSLNIILLGIVCSYGNEVLIDFNDNAVEIAKFWTNTGFSPNRTTQESTADNLLSKDTELNLALISALPYKAITHVRVHWLLDLLSFNESKEIKWKKLDNFIQLIVKYGLKPKFEIMGKPTNVDVWTNFSWYHLCYNIAERYSGIYGFNEVEKWIFETWNEPDLRQYNIFNFTLNEYINYVNNCISGIKNVSKTFIVGGPAGLFKEKNHELCWGFLNYCDNNIDKCKLDYISFHKKGYPRAILNSSLEMQNIIRKTYKNLSDLRLVNDESDIMTGWWRQEEWRGDVRYAAAIAKTIGILYQHYKKIPIFISNDNAFLNDKTSYFNQRTLLTRFVTNTTKRSRHFFKKPSYTVMTLLSFIENNYFFLNHTNHPKQLTTIATCSNKVKSNHCSVILIHTNDDMKIRKREMHLKAIITLPNTFGEGKYIVYTLSNNLMHPKLMWEKLGKPHFPSFIERKKLRLSEGAHWTRRGIVETRQLKITLNLFQPSITLINICSQKTISPVEIIGLRSIKIADNEVLLIWKDTNMQSRCIETYLVEFLYVTSFNTRFERINKENIIECSFHHAIKQIDSRDSVSGIYRVAALDYWGRKAKYQYLNVQ